MHSSPVLRCENLQDERSDSPHHLTSSSRRLSISPQTHASEIGLEIHPGLQPLLTTPTHAHEHFATLEQSRERRVRLLLRRLINQIQYGCQNPQCDVPTCLSYRKRESLGPVRTYSDVVARALAWKCLEQYTGNGRDFHRLDEKSFRIRIQKRARSHNHPFCCNAPVVPWYQNPAETLEKRRKSGRQDGSVSVKAEDTKSIKFGTRKQKPMLPATALLPQGLVKDERNANIRPNVHTAPADAEKTGKTVEVAHHPDDEAGLSASQSPNVKRDFASFAQFLFNQKAITRFDQRPEEEDSPITDTVPLVELNSVVNTEATKNDPEKDKQVSEYPEQSTSYHASNLQSDLRGTTSMFSYSCTFRRLTASAVLWMKLRLQADDFEGRWTSNSGPADPASRVALKSLAHQSIHFVLSHPLRLVNSAKTWDFIGHSAGRPYEVPSRRLGLDQINDLVSDVLEKEQCSTPVTPRTCLPSWESIHCICTAIQSIISPQGSQTIANHLFAALQHCYILPDHSQSQEGLEDDKTSKPEAGMMGVSLDDSQVAYLLVLTVGLINGLTYGGGTVLDQHCSADFSHFHVMHPNSFIVARATGQVYPQTSIKQMYQYLPESMRTAICREFLRNTYWASDPSIDRLITGIADIISHRLAASAIAKALGRTATNKRKARPQTIVQAIVQTLAYPPVRDLADFILIGDHYSLRLLLHMQHVLLSKWNRAPVVTRTSPVGGALEMLAEMYRQRQVLRFEASYFQMQFVAASLNEVDMPFEWLSFQETGQSMHILQFAFLFDAATLVRYFRSINLKVMQQAHEHALAIYVNAKTHLIHTAIPVYGVKEILEKTRPHMARYFVMTISRQNVLEDAINQIWRRQKQELLRPLKVQVDKDDGEEGLDHGGVQQEFFRLLFAEALDAEIGMFTIDDTTRMTWFQPASLEPLYKFEALGVLLSLAVYNSITMPLTFPLAFYRKLLGLKVKNLEHIEDGWPVLSQGLKTLLEWDNGDVGDVIMRTYEFSYEAFGRTITVDMEKVGRQDEWPPVRNSGTQNNSKSASFEFPPSPLTTSPSTSPALNLHAEKSAFLRRTPTPVSLENEPEAKLVTNDNREMYVKDYIYWLTNKSIQPQFEAFAKGFHACLNPTALSIFTPEALKQVIEGHQDIDIDGLERTASYDEYSTNDQLIQDFWSVVRDFTPEQHGKLLEFVTASNRVPVNGIESITFTIQKNGEGDDRLPSSSTCYGRLLLPHYSNKEVLRAKLEKAIENSIGFGSL